MKKLLKIGLLLFSTLVLFFFSLDNNVFAEDSHGTKFGVTILPPEHTVTVSVSPSGTGQATGGGTFTYGEFITVQASPNTGYNFVNWTEGGIPVSSSSSYTFRLTRDRDLVANFQIRQYTISVSANPASGGTVSGGGVYNHGQNVTVSASAGDIFNFVEWREGNSRVSSSANYSFTVTSNRNLVAIFSLKSYTISATVEGSGGVTGAGNYLHGSPVTLRATPNVGHRFIEWLEGGNIVSSNATYNFTATRNRSLVAKFEIMKYTISLSTEGEGSVSGGGQYDHGQAVNISATPASGNSFVRWEENRQSITTSRNHSFTATRNRSLVAIFTVVPTPPPPPPPAPEVTTYTIAATSSENGSIEPSGNVSVQEGQNRSFAMSPEPGYGVLQVFVDGDEQGRISNYSFRNVRKNHTIHVDFQRMIKVEVEDGDGGRWTLNLDQLRPFFSGDRLRIATGDINVYDGYRFEKVTVIDSAGDRTTILPNNLPYILVIGDRDLLLRFEFVEVDAPALPVAPVLPPDEIDEEERRRPRTIIDSVVVDPVSVTVDRAVTTIRDLPVDDRNFQAGSNLVGSAVAPLTLFSLLSGQFGLYYYILQFLLNLLGVLGLHKKGKPYAVVYNSVTKEPVNRAIIRVYNKEGKLVHTDVSNVYGVFSRDLEDGTYSMKVFARGFVFPSNVVTGTSDAPYQNVYKGGLFTVRKDNPLQYAVPVDPVEINKIKYAKAIFVNRLTNYLGFFQKMLVILGFALSIFVYIRVPTTFNLVILIIYIPLLFLSFLSVFSKEKGYGRVRVQGDELKKSDIVIGLREMEFERLVDKRVCDDSGRYRFLVSGGKYRLEVLNPGYALSETKIFEGPKNKPLFINANLTVQKSVQG
jgi:hypothetical protein